MLYECDEIIQVVAKLTGFANKLQNGTVFLLKWQQLFFCIYKQFIAKVLNFYLRFVVV